MRKNEREWQWAVLSILLVIVCGANDYFIVPELSIFYLIPVSIATWRVNRRMGGLIAFLSAAIWLIAYGSASAAIPYWETIVRLGFFLVTVFILSRLKEALEEEKRLARIDETTGIANRKSFLETARHEFEKSRRHRHPFTLVYMDVDDFKKVNDTYGHQAGDRLLRTIGRTMKTSLRGYDLVARIGGDEFILLCPETGQDGAHEVIGRIQERLKAAVNTHGYAVTFSFGVATFTAAPASLNDAVGLADTLMYSVKKRGKDSARFEIYTGATKEAAAVQ
jgi:diguanylate cyclase (GGDEF)-like protein